MDSDQAETQNNIEYLRQNKGGDEIISDETQHVLEDYEDLDFTDQAQKLSPRVFGGSPAAETLEASWAAACEDR